MTEISVIHTNPLTALGPHAWGWEIPVYLFLGGISAGLMVFAYLLGRALPDGERSLASRLSVLGVPVALSLGMLALFIDLEYRTHAYRFYLAFMVTSPMSWGSWILLAIYPTTLALGLGELRAQELERLTSWRPLRIFSGILIKLRIFCAAHLIGLRRASLVLGIALGAYTGILLGTLGARPAWNTTLLGPLFLVSGVSTGAALMMLLPVGHGEHRLLRGWDMGAVVVELILLALLLIGLTSSGADGRAAARLFLGGELTALFWSLVVVAGLGVPLVVELLEARKGLKPTFLAPLLLLGGGLSLRFILVMAGQITL